MRFILTLLLLLSYSNSFSCYNEYYALDAKGQFHQIEETKRILFMQHFDLIDIEKQLISLEQKLKKKADFRLLSDYGLHLVQAGKVKEGLVIFEKLAELHPNEYSIIANLGTTYELSGQNELALEYIRRGIQLNPNSHGGSEWIHVKILEAKIALAKDPDYLSNHTVLNLNANQKQSQKVFDQLYIQLQERVPFSPKEPNPIMADLFVEMGDFYFENISFEHAKAFYQIAKIYYKSDRKDIDEKIGKARKLREKYAASRPDASNIKRDPSIKQEVPSEMTTSIKVAGIPYQDYFHNPPGSDYSINWSKIETDPVKLLAYAGIQPESPKESKAVPDSTLNDGRHIKATVTVTKTKIPILWIGLTLATLIIAIFTYFKARRKK
ncbi:MAG: hypothetical protein ACO1N0_11330 [Fluviicola sp.]